MINADCHTLGPPFVGANLNTLLYCSARNWPRWQGGYTSMSPQELNQNRQPCGGFSASPCSHSLAKVFVFKGVKTRDSVGSPDNTQRASFRNSQEHKQTTALVCLNEDC